MIVTIEVRKHDGSRALIEHTGSDEASGDLIAGAVRDLRTLLAGAYLR
ncbi:MAG TPA: hypothetical protein VN088_14510 [Nocardioides sp.]|nr:hypothetical protein [Nocardioides sp.]